MFIDVVILEISNYIEFALIRVNAIEETYTRFGGNDQGRVYITRCI